MVLGMDMKKSLRRFYNFCARYGESLKQSLARHGRRIEDYAIYVISGISLGYYLNDALSYRNFRASTLNQIIIFIFIPFLLASVLVISFKKIDRTSLYTKARTVLLGASFTSLSFSFVAFMKYHLPTFYGGAIYITATFFTDIYKSLFLASLFSAIERSVKFLEDRGKAR